MVAVGGGDAGVTGQSQDGDRTLRTHRVTGQASSRTAAECSNPIDCERPREASITR